MSPKGPPVLAKNPGPGVGVGDNVGVGLKVGVGDTVGDVCGVGDRLGVGVLVGWAGAEVAVGLEGVVVAEVELPVGVGEIVGEIVGVSVWARPATGFPKSTPATSANERSFDLIFI